MKKGRLHIFIFVIGIAFMSSCVVQKEVSIEVLKPAKDPLESDYSSLVLVDNTKQQPANKGNYFTIKKYNHSGKMRRLSRKQISDSVIVDSLGFSCVFNAANRLIEDDYLQSINVWQQNMSDAERKWNAQMLSPSEVKQIADSSDAELVVSLDLLSYISEIKKHQYPQNYLILLYDPNIPFYTAQTEYLTLWRYYDGKTMQLLGSKSFQDTLFFEIASTELDEALIVDLLQTMASEAAWEAGSSAVGNFFPGWKKVSRVYFRSGSPGLRIGSRFYENGKLDEAYSEWLKVYNTSRGKLKARAALNIAFYFELKDNLDKTREYLENARFIYLDSKMLSESTTDYELIKNYIEVVEKRVKEDEKLKKQISI